MKLIPLIIAACFLLSAPSYGQNNCGCSDYVKIAEGTTWYKNSTSEQREYIYLLEAFEKSYDALNKVLSGSTSGSYAAIFNGSLSVSEADYKEHFSEYRQHIENKITESYQSTSLTQYPLELIKGLEECHAGCSDRPSIACTALSSDPDTVIFNVQYQQPRNSAVQPPMFRDNILKPTKVAAVGNPVEIKGTPVRVGANTFRFDRSKEPQQFTISARISPAPDTCQAVVPAIEHQAAIPEFNSICEFNDAGFADQFSTRNSPPGYKKTYTCYNLKPGARFLAVFSGLGEVNDPNPANWLGLWLTSPMEDPNVTASPRSDYTNTKQFVISNSLAGRVPTVGANAGSASVTVELAFCQVGDGVPAKCSTKGNARLVITSFLGQ
jgi:hypothetical protein